MHSPSATSATSTSATGKCTSAGWNRPRNTPHPWPVAVWAEAIAGIKQTENATTPSPLRTQGLPQVGQHTVRPRRAGSAQCEKLRCRHLPVVEPGFQALEEVELGAVRPDG